VILPGYICRKTRTGPNSTVRWVVQTGKYELNVYTIHFVLAWIMQKLDQCVLTYPPKTLHDPHGNERLVVPERHQRRKTCSKTVHKSSNQEYILSTIQFSQSSSRQLNRGIYLHNAVVHVRFKTVPY